jgi:hypothetical protein
VWSRGAHKDKLSLEYSLDFELLSGIQHQGGAHWGLDLSLIWLVVTQMFCSFLAIPRSSLIG